MSKKPSTAAPAPAKDAKPAATESAAPKTTGADSAAATSEASAPAKNSSGSSRPISYFSSVSTDEYRAGWESIFGGKEAKASPPKRKSKLPISLQLDIDDLDPSAREHIEKLLSQKARAKRLSFAKLAKENTVTITINCEITE